MKYLDSLEGSLREKLTGLRERLKDDDFKKIFVKENDSLELLQLFDDDDPKVRKSAANIFKELSDVLDEAVGKKVCDRIYKAYVDEDTLFVKGSYIKALSGYDTADYKEAFKEEFDRLCGIKPSEADKKHILEIVTALSVLLKSDRNKHFNTDLKDVDVMLLCSYEFRDLLKEDMETSDFKQLKSGLFLEHADYDEYKDIRLYNEALIKLPGSSKKFEADSVAAFVNRCDIFKVLGLDEKDSLNFYASVVPRADNDAFLKKFCDELVRLSKARLINDTSDYDIEIRIIKRKDDCIVVLKPMWLKDKRFSYRKNFLPTSASPYLCAVMARLSYNAGGKKDKSNVLDPFCGVGTTLIERAMLSGGCSLYGIDKYAKAIDFARENTQIIGVPINYINRDFFDFEHKYLFDEVITEVPYDFAALKDADTFFEEFFRKLKKHVHEASVVVLLNRQKKEMINNAKKHGFVAVNTYDVDLKSGRNISVLRCSRV